MPMGWIYRKRYGAPAMGFASNRKRQKVGFRKAGHDVSDEPRDERGRWTTGGATARTQRWRTAVRGVDRLAQEIHEAATAQLEGRPLDEYQRQLMQTPIGRAVFGSVQRYNTPEAWENRAMVGLPGARFDENGRLANAAELRPRYAAILRERNHGELMTRMRPSDLLRMSQQ